MERKIYPRVAKQFSAVVENDDGLQLNVIAIDASSESVNIQCNMMKRNLITPGGSFISNGKPLELIVWLKLPFDGEDTKIIAARCQVDFSRRISKDQCEIGMRYMGFGKGMYDTLLNYIELIAASNHYAKAD